LKNIRKCVEEEDYIKENENTCSNISRNIHPKRIFIVTHNVFIIDKLYHEYHHNRKKETVNDLTEPHDFDKGKIWYKYN